MPVQPAGRAPNAANRSSCPFLATRRPTQSSLSGASGSCPSRGGGLRALPESARGRAHDRRAACARARGRRGGRARRGCRSRPIAHSRASRSAPNPAWSRCPWHGPKSSSPGPREAPRSAPRCPACAGSGHEDGPPPARASGEHERLSEPPQPRCGRVTAQVVQDNAQERREAALAAGPGEAAHHTAWIVAQIFRQVGDRRCDRLVHRMPEPVGRST